MRQQRANMIQTDQQYKFVYEALLEKCQFGNTEIDVAELSDWLAEQSRTLPGGKTGLAHEVIFQRYEIFIRRRQYQTS